MDSITGKQYGVALVTMLLALALVTTIAATMIENEFLTIRRAENLQLKSQAWEYAFEAEKWAGRKLVRDAVANGYDHLGEDWNHLGKAIAVEGGSIKVDVVDMQSRFNLNNLQGGNKDKVWYPAFQRLLIALKLNKELANAVVDWIDTDSIVSNPGGAEDYEYLGKDPPYRAANQLFRDISELRRVKGFDDKTFDIIRPYVSAILSSGVKINVNTCDVLLLRILSPGQTLLPQSDAESLATGRGKSGYKDIASFLASAALSGNRNRAAQPLVSVGSDYFFVKSKSNVGRMNVNIDSLLERYLEQNKIGVRVKSRHEVLR